MIGARVGGLCMFRYVLISGVMKWYGGGFLKAFRTVVKEFEAGTAGTVGKVDVFM